MASGTITYRVTQHRGRNRSPIGSTPSSSISPRAHQFCPRRAVERAIAKALSVFAVTAVLTVGAAFATTIQLIVDRDSGEAFLKNEGTLDAAIDAYSLTSPSGQLVVGDWTSISGNYDIAGDMSVDQFAAWFALPGSGSDLSEFSLLPLSGSLAPGQFVSLGELYPAAGPEDLTISIAADTTVADVAADFRTLTADYDGDLDVDSEDYAVFVATFGSTTDLRADGNADGVINASDYTVWRDSEELVPTPAPSASASGAVSVLAIGVPEPGALLLLAIAISPLLPLRQRRLAAG